MAGGGASVCMYVCMLFLCLLYFLLIVIESELGGGRRGQRLMMERIDSTLVEREKDPARSRDMWFRLIWHNHKSPDERENWFASRCGGDGDGVEEGKPQGRSSRVAHGPR